MSRYYYRPYSALGPPARVWVNYAPQPTLYLPAPVGVPAPYIYGW
jgi:hypothetical protein